jgi:prefoldin subunit 5
MKEARNERQNFNQKIEDLQKQIDQLRAESLEQRQTLVWIGRINLAKLLFWLGQKAAHKLFDLLDN